MSVGFVRSFLSSLKSSYLVSLRVFSIEFKRISATSLILIFLSLALTFVPNSYAQSGVEITNDEVREITLRLQGYSQPELIERQLFLQNTLQEMDEEGTAEGTSQSSRANILMELSIIEQLLILTGAVLLNNWFHT